MDLDKTTLTTKEVNAHSMMLCNLQLHEIMFTKHHVITRVPGGWIYYPIGSKAPGTFIPYVFLEDL